MIKKFCREKIKKIKGKKNVKRKQQKKIEDEDEIIEKVDIERNKMRRREVRYEV